MQYSMRIQSRARTVVGFSVWARLSITIVSVNIVYVCLRISWHIYYSSHSLCGRSVGCRNNIILYLVNYIGTRTHRSICLCPSKIAFIIHIKYIYPCYACGHVWYIFRFIFCYWCCTIKVLYYYYSLCFSYGKRNSTVVSDDFTAVNYYIRYVHTFIYFVISP